MTGIDGILSFTIGGISLKIYSGAFLAILGGFLAKWIVTGLMGGIAKSAGKTRTAVDDMLIGAFIKPAGWACLLGGLYGALLILPLPAEPVDLRQFSDALVKGFSILLIVWCAALLLDGLVEVWKSKAEASDSKLDDQLVPLVHKAGKAFLYVIGIVLFLQNLGYSVASLIAGLGLGGAAIALASKDTLANFFGSVVIFIDRPFHVGDWIEMDGIEGTVEEIGLRTTRIRTFANSLITMPNSMLTTQAIENWSRMKKRRIKMNVGVTYGTSPEKMEQLVAGIRAIIAADETLCHDFYLVYFNAFGPSSLDVFVYCFTVSTVWADYLAARQNFMLKIMRLVEDLGLEFAFPTQTLHVASFPPSKEKAG